MQITAEERGRRLVLTVGGPTPDMDELDAAEAAEDVVRVSVPPVSARVGSQLFAFYAGIAFARQESLDAVGFTGSPEQAVEHMTRLALGALELPDDRGGSEAQRVIARERWRVVQDLRWDEAQRVCNVALFWNLQGGGIEAARMILDDGVDAEGRPTGGIPKAQTAVLEANGLTDAFSRLSSLLDSELSTPTSTAATPSGSDESSPSDESEPSPISEPSTEPSASPTPTKTTTSRSRSSRSGSSGKSTRTASGASRSSTGTRSPRSTSTSTSDGTTRTTPAGTTGRGPTSTPASEA